MVLSLWSLLAALFGLGLAIGVVIAVKLKMTCNLDRFPVWLWEWVGDPSRTKIWYQILQVGLLFFFQIRSILRNQTGIISLLHKLYNLKLNPTCSGIEDWIREKADYRLASSGARFVWPYDVGRWNNLKQVFFAHFESLYGSWCDCVSFVAQPQNRTMVGLVPWNCKFELMN